ncbi:lamina-associated polypeptide 2, isoforms beta/delta/epsilon/gamma isoform X3 [Fundulus heteroclitus]|uniref:lamina-associated polypeptide 2, isoforms beta/delta/epsilon/gamma isoform X3 n=1 Tax=Fundulus heteroclitus TaxID=8078 RepID=UPI00165C66BC|nr:lamina-associated polypeptide 2, isoforms beta/delta/epsilon/gamma isoform X3 [Fundulus heteroclitus]
MPFVEDPAQLSKSRLKSDLVAHHVALPPAASKKELYVELHLKHIDQSNCADFSSDDEDPVHDVVGEDPENVTVLDPSALTDKDLKDLLLKHGVKAGPIVGSTRAVYEKKLWKLLQSGGKEELNEAENAVLYSDSDEEEEGDENKEEQEEPEGKREQTAEALKLNQQRCNERPCPLKQNEWSSKRNSKNAVRSSEQTREHRSQIPAGISKVSIAQHSGLRSGVPSGSQSVVSNGCSSRSSQAFSITEMVVEMESRTSPTVCSDKELSHSSKQEHRSRSSRLLKEVEDKDVIVDQAVRYTPKDSTCVKDTKPPQEPENDILKEIFPDTNATPTGIYATPRRPIKGAAQRPIQYAYPKTPVSPTTLERREVERRLVPIYIQILVFFTVVYVLYVISVIVEDGSSVMPLLQSLNQWSDSEEGSPALDETQDMHSALGEL